MAISTQRASTMGVLAVRFSSKSSHLIARLLLYLGTTVASIAALAANSVQPVTRVAEIRGVARDVIDIRFSNDGKKIFARRDDGTSIIWEPSKSDGFQNVRCSTVIGDGDRCVSESDDVKVFELSTGKALYSLNTSGDVFVSPIGSYIAVATATDGIVLFDGRQGSRIANLASKWGFENVLFSENETVLAGSGAADFVVYDLKRRKVTKIDVTDVRSFAISKNGSLLWAASGFAEPQVLAATGKRASRNFPDGFSDRYSDSVFGRFMDADSKVVMRTILGKVGVWDWKSNAFAEIPTVAEKLATSEKGILTVTPARVMELWDRNIRKVVTFDGRMRLGAMTPDGTHISTVSFDGSLALWDVRP